jgi:hypothetical protein
VNEETLTAHWQQVTPGIQTDDAIQILEPPLSGRVITLGQHLLDEGTKLVLPTSSE